MKLEENEMRDVSYEVRNFLRSYHFLKDLSFDPEELNHVAQLTLLAVSCRSLIEYFELRKCRSSTDYRYKGADISGVDAIKANEIWLSISRGASHLSQVRDLKRDVTLSEWLDCLKLALGHFFENVEGLPREHQELWNALKKHDGLSVGTVTTFPTSHIVK